MDYISVLIVNQSLEEKGIIANLGLVMGLTAGRLLPQDTFGGAVTDGDGAQHTFLTRIGHTVRKASGGKLASLRKTFIESEDCIVVDYTEDAAPADYQAYATALAQHRGDEISYRAIYVYGPNDVVLPLTKNLSRL